MNAAAKIIEDRFHVIRVLNKSDKDGSVLLSVEERAIQAGFDQLDTKSPAPSRHGILLIYENRDNSAEILAQWRDWYLFKAEGLADMFNCGLISTPDLLKGALYALFENGTLLENKLNSISLPQFKSGVCSFLRGLKTLQQRGLAIRNISLDSVLCVSDQWKLIPGDSIYKGDSFLENIRQAGKLFMDLLVENEWTIDEGIRVLLGRCCQATTNESIEAMLQHKLWEMSTPEEAVPRILQRRIGNKVELKWEMSEDTDVRLFSFNQPIPPDANKLILTSELESWSQINVFTLGTLQLEVNPNRIERLVPVVVSGPWTRVGRAFLIGGLPDAVISNGYISNNNLILEIEWPENISQVRIIARPDRSAYHPKDGGERGKTFTHQKYPPLPSKSIPQSISIPINEFSGWTNVYIQIFSQSNNDGNISFSLGINPHAKWVLKEIG